MTDPNYSFLIPAVKDFPDEPVKKKKSNVKKDEPKDSEEEDVDGEDDDDE